MSLLRTIALVAAVFLATPLSAQRLAVFPDEPVQDIAGDWVRSTDGLGRGNEISVMVFWSTWCKPCIDQLDAIAAVNARWMANYRAKVTIVAVGDRPADVAKFLQSKNWSSTVLIDPDMKLSQKLGIQSVPSVVVVNAQRNFDTHTGFEAGEMQRLEKTLKQWSGARP